jgi:alginate O-acetyltransferase complex protein AlgI
VVFSSPIFLFVFLPVACVLALVSARNIRAQNALLALVSVFFYAWGNPAFALLLLVSTVVNYMIALRLGAVTPSPDAPHTTDAAAAVTAAAGAPSVHATAEAPPSAAATASHAAAVSPSVTAMDAARLAAARKLYFTLCVVFNIGLLCVFKYTNFLVENLNRLPGVDIPDPGIPLPIGISFFTFQAMSYVLDVYGGRVRAQRSLVGLLLYISFFPQLIAGPIVRYGDIEPLLFARAPNVRDAAYGLRRFIVGLSKKLLLANTVGAVADTVFKMNHAAAASAAGAGASAAVAVSGAEVSAAASAAIASQGALSDTLSGALPLASPVAWLGAIAYALQIYYDFSGYSDMAIGLGRMLGFSFRENFEWPYAAVGMRDFWRKWHISLSVWFREYVYIPLGGNRRGKLREGANKLIVFFLTGLWHGANWTFVVWGMFHGLFLMLETYGVIRIRRLPKPVAWLYTVLVAVVGFVIFRTATLTDAGWMLSSMFFGGARGDFAAQLGQALSLLRPSAIPAFAVAALAVFPIVPALTARLPKLQAAGFALSVPLFFLCVLNLASATYNPFIYFRF